MISPVPSLTEKYGALQRLFHSMGSTVVAFSGGIDSTLVLKVAFDTLGKKVLAITAISPTFPASELTTVQHLSHEIGAPLRVIETNQLAIEAFVQNDAGRCLHCKTDLYQALDPIRQEMAFQTIVDGTNMDDLKDDRPGIQAARRLGVRSPLVEAGLGKSDIRELAKGLGLSNWNKPAAACLSSRIPRGITITRERLSRVEQAEALLLKEGFTHLRVRDYHPTARIEVHPGEFAFFLDEQRRHRIVEGFKAIGFRFVTVDMEGYRAGSANSG